MIATGAVNPHLCDPPSWIVVSVTYTTDEDDCSFNIVPDECDIARDTRLDCNDNTIPDECDTIEVCDFDDGGNLGVDDYLAFEDCLGGPNVVPNPQVSECVNACLAAFDSDADTDVDLKDFAEFQVAFTGP